MNGNVSFEFQVSGLGFCVLRCASRLLLAASLLLVACADTPPTATRPLAPTTNKPITLTLWHAYEGAPAALLNALANDFHKAYPTITVRVQAKMNEGELLRQGLAALALAQPPDVILADKRTLATFARQNALAPLDALLREPPQGLRDDERADWLPGVLNAGRFPELQNQTFALWFETRAIVLFYNADALRAASSELPRTWEQFGNAARATTRGSARGWVMSPNAAVFYALLFSRGSDVLNETHTRARLDDDAARQTLELIVALTRSGAAYLADSDERARADFLQGKAAFWFGETDDLPRLAEAFARINPRAQWGVANIPQNDPARPVTLADGAALALVRAEDDRVRAGWLLARWLTAPEQSARWTQTTLRVPVRLSAPTLLAPNVPPLFLRLRDGFGTTLPTVRAAPSVKDAARIDAAIVALWTSVANGTDPNAALQTSAARVQRILGNLP